MKLSRYSGKCSSCMSHSSALALKSNGEEVKAICLDCVFDQDAEATNVEARLHAWKGRGLYDFQRRGIAWLKTQRACLLADDQGLGKTIQVIASIGPEEPLIIVCPAIAKKVWKEHLSKLKPDYTVTVGKGFAFRPTPAPKTASIINYEILPPCWEEPGKEKKLWTDLNLRGQKVTLIYDEGHYLKNRESDRSRRGQALANSVLDLGGRVVVATGTPIKKDPPDLFTLLDVIGRRKELWLNYEEFRKDLGGETLGERDKWSGSVASDVAPRLRQVMLRRLKVNVLKGLAKKVRSTKFVDISEEAMKACDEVARVLAKEHGINLQEDILAAIEGAEGVPFELISATCRALAVAKIPALKKVIEENSHRGPMLVWSRHKDPLKFVDTLEGWEKIDGDTTQKNMDRIEREFQAGNLKGLGLSIPKASTAITLTRASFAIFLDRSWSPADNFQAEDRIHRIGQDSDVCEYLFLVANHYLDERLSTLLDLRSITFDDAINAAAVGGWNGMLAADLN